MATRSTRNVSGTLLDRVYRNPIFNETIRDVSNPQLNTGATVADRLGINYDLDEILKIFQDAVAAGNAVTQEMYDQATDKYYQNVAAQTADYLDSMRKANAEALTTGASRGVAAANELSTMLGMSQQGQDAALDLALEGLNLGDQMGADMAQAYEDAYNQYNDLGLQMGQLDNEAFAYLVQQYLGELQFLAEQQALMNSGANIGQYYPNYGGGGTNVGVGVGAGGSGNGEFTPYDRDAQEIVNQLGEDTIANIFQLGLRAMEAARGADRPAPSMGGFLNPNPDYINKIANEHAQGYSATGEGGALVENMYNQGTIPQREVSGPAEQTTKDKSEVSQVGGAGAVLQNPMLGNIFAQGLGAMLNQSNEDDDDDGTKYNPDTGRGSNRTRSIAAMRQAVAKQAQKTPAAAAQNALRNRTRTSSEGESTPYNRNTVQTQNRPRPSYSSSSSSRRPSSSSSSRRPSSSSSSRRPSSSGGSNWTSRPVNSGGVTVNKPGYSTGGWIGNNRPSGSSSNKRPSSNGMFGGVTGNIIGNAIKGSISSALNQNKKKKK